MGTPKRSQNDQFLFGSASKQNPAFAPVHDAAALEAGLQIIFKGLQKRDTVTRERASEDLGQWLHSNSLPADESAQEALITTFASMYVTLAIDVSRKVRANAHKSLGMLIAAYKKRVSRYLSGCAPFWQLGLFDNDRLVVRAATEAYETSFPSADKRAEFARVFASSIVGKCEELIFDETPESLSDSRFVNKDDSDAKYSNVTSAALAVLMTVAKSDSSKLGDKLNDLETTNLWKLVQTNDGGIQRATLELLTTLISLESSTSSTNAVSSKLATVIPKIHASNTIHIMKLLLALGSVQPDAIYGNTDSGKKSLPSRVTKLIRSGPPVGTSQDYWCLTVDLLLTARQCKDANDAMFGPLLLAMQESTRRASKQQTEVAFRQFSRLCLGYATSGSEIATNIFLDLLSTDIRSLPSLTIFSSSIHELAGLHQSLARSALQKLETQAMQLFTSQSSEDLRTLLSWKDLLLSLSDRASEDLDIWGRLCQSVQLGVPERHNNGIAYPYICETIPAIPAPTIAASRSTKAAIEEFLKDLPLQALSSTVSTLKLISAVSDALDQSQADIAIQSMLSRIDSHGSDYMSFVSGLCETAPGRLSSGLSEWLEEDVSLSTTIDAQRWDLYQTFCTTFASEASVSQFLMSLMLAVSTKHPEQADPILRMITTVAVARPNVLSLSESQAEALCTMTWKLSKISSTNCLCDCLHQYDSNGPDVLQRALRRSIWDAVLMAGPNSTSIHAITLATDSITFEPVDTAPMKDDLSGLLVTVLPSTLPSGLTIVHPLGSLVHLAQSEELKERPRTDHQGLSQYFRACSFVSHRKEANLAPIKPSLLIALEICNTKVQYPSANSIWCDTKEQSPDHSDLLDPVSVESVTQALIRDIIDGREEDLMSVMAVFAGSKDRSVKHFYEAAALYRLLCKARELKIASEVSETLFTQSADDLFLHVATCSALNEQLLGAKKSSFQRNKLASDLTGKMPEEKAISSLMKLNALLPQDVTGVTILPRQRLMFLIKNLLELAHASHPTCVLTYQLCTLFLRLLPEVETEYGSFWQTLIDYLHKQMKLNSESNSDISVQYASLKILAWLSANFEKNDDLSEFWLNTLPQTERLLAKLFMATAQREQTDQAVTLSTSISARLMRTVKLSSLDEADRDQVAALVADSAEHVQSTALAIQAKLVDEEREEMILSSALAKEYEEVSAALPPQLLSIVLDCPMEEQDLEESSSSSHRPLPSSHKGYFLTWLSIFRYFQDTPLRMRMKLIDDLRNLDLIEPLLGLIFAIMRLLDDRPADIAAIVETADFGKEEEDVLSLVTLEADERDARLAYATHLYYACLLHVPALVRGWWIECKDRVLSSAVEQLTEKHYSRRLVQQEVASLQSETSRKFLRESNVRVRVSNGGRDVVTTYEIDEQTMEMAVRLPLNYPLRRVAVEGIQRVGVRDAQFRAWLLASQAVLTAQNGSLLDAISLFQRNVSLHFEGVADCNICFSILSVQDKSLPSKRCQTCKNLFHSSCLFKWFKSSSQSRCPLCRASFAF